MRLRSKKIKSLEWQFTMTTIGRIHMATRFAWLSAPNPSYGHSNLFNLDDEKVRSATSNSCYNCT